jgi:fructokinase
MSDQSAARPVIFGEVLFDRFPDGAVVLGGAPFNVAWHLQAFGQKPLFVSRVGDDPLGRQIRDRMLHWGMDCSGLQLDSIHPTGTVEVSLVDDEPSYEIVAERAYDHVAGDYLPPLPSAGLLYHGTLALRAADSRAALERLRRAAGLPVFVDVNLRPPWYALDDTRALLEQARWAKLNEDELDLLVEHGADLERGARKLQNDAGLDVLVVTRGARGAIARTAEGHLHAVEPTGGLPVVDTVGAGDAFTSVLILGLLREWPMAEILERAQSFASRLVGVRGATVDQAGFYAEFRDDWGLG